MGAYVPARWTRLLIDEFDFSGDTSGLTLALAVDEIDAPALQQLALQRIPGLPGARLEHNGYYTGPDADELEAELHDRMGSETGVTIGVLFDTRAVGNPAYVLENVWGQQLTLDAPIKDLLTIAGAWPENAAYRGYTLLDDEIDATGAGTVVDLGSTLGVDGRAFLFVREITGAAVDATVVVQMDTAAGFSSPTTLATFEFSAVGVVALDITGAVERYLRINVTDLGGADAFVAACIVCVSGVTMEVD